MGKHGSAGSREYNRRLEEEEVTAQIQRTDVLLTQLPKDAVYKIPLPLSSTHYEFVPCTRYNYARYLALIENQMLYLACKN